MHGDAAGHLAGDQRSMWERISDAFGRTRARPWPHVETFLRTLAPGSWVLDAMAGNGRHTRLAQDLGLEAVWCDWSRPAALAAGCGRAVVGDVRALPMRSAAFAAAIVVAGIPSVPGAAQRLQALREVRRVVAPQGPVQLTVWSRQSARFADVGPPGPIDVQVPWRAQGAAEVRQYHLFTEASLREAMQDAGFHDVLVEDVRIGREENLVATARA